MLTRPAAMIIIGLLIFVVGVFVFYFNAEIATTIMGTDVSYLESSNRPILKLLQAIGALLAAVGGGIMWLNSWKLAFPDRFRS